MYAVLFRKHNYRYAQISCDWRVIYKCRTYDVKIKSTLSGVKLGHASFYCHPFQNWSN
jgi:hypothetical protein